MQPSSCIIGIFLRGMETYIHTKIHTGVFIATLFIAAPNWKQPRCPPTEERLSKLWYIHGILPHNKKEQSLDTFNNLNTSPGR